MYTYFAVELIKQTYGVLNWMEDCFVIYSMCHSFIILPQSVLIKFIFLSNQNADLKKQLHELQAKITALSEKQVGKLVYF